MHLFSRGRILKVKLGYNANSSSLAAFVTYFLWGSAAAVIVINMITAVLFSKKDNAKETEVKNEPEKSH